MVSYIYPKELKLNKADSSDTSEAFLDLDPSILYEKRDDFIFNVVNLSLSRWRRPKSYVLRSECNFLTNSFF